MTYTIKTQTSTTKIIHIKSNTNIRSSTTSTQIYYRSRRLGAVRGRLDLRKAGGCGWRTWRWRWRCWIWSLSLSVHRWSWCRIVSWPVHNITVAPMMWRGGYGQKIPPVSYIRNSVIRSDSVRPWCNLFSHSRRLGPSILCVHPHSVINTQCWQRACTPIIVLFLSYLRFRNSSRKTKGRFLW